VQASKLCVGWIADRSLNLNFGFELLSQDHTSRR
jgi:hypothetical protein